MVLLYEKETPTQILRGNHLFFESLWEYLSTFLTIQNWGFGQVLPVILLGLVGLIVLDALKVILGCFFLVRVFERATREKRGGGCDWMC